VNKRVMAEPFRRGAPGQWEVRRLRAGVFRLGGYLGLDTRAVVRFGEAISGQRGDSAAGTTWSEYWLISPSSPTAWC
jgi:hypothetical protein